MQLNIRIEKHSPRRHEEKKKRLMFLVPKLQLSSLYTNVTKPVISAWTAGIQATWTYLKLPSLALDPLLGGYDGYLNTCV